MSIESAKRFINSLEILFPVEPKEVPVEPKKEIPDLVLNYCLFLPAYPGEYVPTSVSTKYVVESKQTQASKVGHFNSISVRTLCNIDGSSISNSYILLKGIRTPGDVDSGDLDANGKSIIRDVKRMYFEEFEITVIDDEGKNIGGFGGQLQYQDEGTGTTTSVPLLTFPINQAYGKYSEYIHGEIVWQYDNEGIYLRTLTVSPPKEDLLGSQSTGVD
tara:strand:+ start:60 stop:710 length:651 start_codon:yes stop_codon:yes gene_type:complete